MTAREERRVHLLVATLVACTCLGRTTAATPPSPFSDATTTTTTTSTVSPAADLTNPTTSPLLKAVVGTAARTTITVLPVQLTNITKGQNNTSGWEACPHVNGISQISCTCDVPHTVRCRGQASKPGDLTHLMQIFSSKDNTVSLLDLAIHGMGQLPSEAFKNMKLLGLVITKAGLEAPLPPNAFSGLENTLAALGLPNNELKSVPIDALRPLKELERLDLSDNHLQELPPRAFPALLQLENLDLAGNGLRLLQPEVFVFLPHLLSLNLAHNQLDAAQLNDRTLRGLHALQRLSLKSNLLKGAITPTLITGAKGLISLDLSDNALTKLTRGALSECPNLRELDLSHNKIDVIEDHSFANLSQLRRLKLSHNRVVAVSGWSLAHLSQLLYLAMADNALRAVTTDLLYRLPALQSLDLDANDISLIQPPHIFNATPGLQHLSLTDNPLHCDCNLAWLAHWLAHHLSLTQEERVSAVCVTPPTLENAPVVELNKAQFVCSEETSYHDYYQDYYHDYYHDDALVEDNLDLKRSDAKITLQIAHWVHRKDGFPQYNGNPMVQDSYFGVELVWKVDERAIPYSCDAVFVYEVIQGSEDSHQVLAEKVAANCTSEGVRDPHQVIVTVPGEALMPGATYRYCLMLIERGTGDQEAFLPGCSEPLLLAAAPYGFLKHEGASHTPQVSSVTAGGVYEELVVHTRVDRADGPCTYTLALVSGHRVVATRQLNCSEARHEFQSLPAGDYVACASPDISGISHKLNHLEHHLKSAKNVSVMLSREFSICTPIITFSPYKDQGMGPVLVLLFTLPGIALVVTLYLIARRVWRGGGVPWRWDPRTQKSSGKYFLYTGETTTPSLSMDPLPSDTSETTTPV